MDVFFFFLGAALCASAIGYAFHRGRAIGRREGWAAAIDRTAGLDWIGDAERARVGADH